MSGSDRKTRPGIRAKVADGRIAGSDWEWTCTQTSSSSAAASRACARPWSLSGAGSVLILTKAEPREGNTGYAQGGIAAAVGPDDSPALHAADTIAAGDGLCDARAVEVLVEDGPTLRPRADGVGRAFDRDADGKPALAIEGAHSARRVLHAHDATGREIGRVLWRRASALPGVADVGSRARGQPDR